MKSEVHGPAGGGEATFRVLGTRPIRHDGIDKVTGRAKYGADVRLAGMLHGKVLRSPHAHARIARIDVSRAAALPGVKAIVTGADLPDIPSRMEQAGEMRLDFKDLSDNVLAKTKVLYDGHAIAAVAAVTAHIAEEALARIDVEYEPLPPVLDLRAATAPGAPILHPALRTRGGEPSDEPTNVASVIEVARGDVAAGFAAADVLVEGEFATATVHQGYIEPHAALAKVDPDGQATVWCSTQGSFDVRAMSARVLGMPVSKIRVVPAEIGGGFGGKTTIYLEPLAILLAAKAGRPVKLVMSRAEVLRATGPTSGSRIRVQMGATCDGRITAVDCRLGYEAGAFPGSPVGPGAASCLAPYALDALRIEGWDVVVNRPKVSAYRAPGATNAAFAVETAIDELASELGMDPIDFRLRNAAREGTAQPMGPRFKRIGLVELLAAAKAHPHWTAPLGEPAAGASGSRRRGRGFACGFWFNGGMQSSATVNVDVDGSASVVTGSPDIGGTRTACAMIAAEALGIAVESVRPSVADTDSIGYTDVTGGSRVAMATGLAVHRAAEDAKRQLCERAARIWQIAPESVRFDDGAAVSMNGEEKRLTVRELAAQFARTGGPLVGRATVNAHSATGPAFAGLIVDVEVDVETGRVDVVRATALQDVGRAIHPAYVEGQMQGGTAQGIGWALNEEYVYSASGALQNAGFLDYRMPVANDLPMIDTVIVEVPNPSHPLGVRGVGEVSIVPPPAAIANAIHNAVGIRLRELPMSPPRVRAALAAKATAER
ncbi:MAG TPA: xanthine dehydrogenase family protein molybdopterin-binding subunit [Candidatus Binatia bacterium]|nr:xanthine dehydrogenase family protein molybdopterin-binding subunit [Candidatus Binatia bacterium]